MLPSRCMTSASKNCHCSIMIPEEIPDQLWTRVSISSIIGRNAAWNSRRSKAATFCVRTTAVFAPKVLVMPSFTNSPPTSRKFVSTPRGRCGLQARRLDRLDGALRHRTMRSADTRASVTRWLRSTFAVMSASFPAVTTCGTGIPSIRWRDLSRARRARGTGTKT